jgi:hypothetical protein
MKLIPLTQGKFAQVDDEDYEYLNQWKWCADTSDQKVFYAKRIHYIEGGKGKIRRKISMHRLIMKVEKPNILIDHKDHDGLNNQKYNLRVATYSQNSMNVTSYKKSTSEYLGVHWDIESKKWKAAIKIKGKQLNLGRYLDEKLAAKAYNTAAIKHYGEFANLNKI